MDEEEVCRSNEMVVLFGLLKSVLLVFSFFGIGGGGRKEALAVR